ncbi:hypothetical protein HPB50_019156 [Hyalomma asiaticum]|uniref:Uncharacterized protein n=1 Tax=Hyalomma asiaticum TaxID=266040 RepID=A0ACB7T9F1_HYAAI|nr:hypothetical protein HPB50_019156 [Hyalomma asiaticum]
MTAAEIELLAEALYCKQNIRRIQARIGKPELAAAFVRRLREGIEQNYSILSITVHCFLLSECSVDEEWFAIRDVTRRNWDIVARAALFVNGTVVDRYGAEALEVVAEQVSLREELAQQLSVSDAEAAALVRTALRSIHSMDDFMRVAGVVKQRVTCESREDGRLQLDDLNEDCWTLYQDRIYQADGGDVSEIKQKN